MGTPGIEPGRPKSTDFKSAASTNSATSPQNTGSLKALADDRPRANRTRRFLLKSPGILGKRAPHPSLFVWASHKEAVLSEGRIDNDGRATLMIPMQSQWTKAISTVCGTVVLFSASIALAATQPSTSVRSAASKAGDTEGYPSAHTPDAIRTWLKTATSLAPSQVISIGADMVVGFAQSGSLDPVTGYIKGAELRGEALSPQFTKVIQGRSSLATLDVNCTTSSALIHQTKIYSKANLSGEVTVLSGSGTWITPPKTAYLSEAIDAICRADFKRPLRDAPPVVVAAVSPPKAPVAIPKPAPAVALAKPVTPVTPATPATPATAITPLVTAAKVGANEVQIIAAPSAQGAETARQHVAQRLPQITSNRPFRIETAVVGGRTYYRGLFGGFSDRASAAAFCRTLSASSISCLVK